MNDVEATTGAESRVNQAVQFFSLLFVLDKALEKDVRARLGG